MYELLEYLPFIATQGLMSSQYTINYMSPKPIRLKTIR